MPSRMVVFGAVLLFWILISTAIGNLSLGLFSRLLESATGGHRGIFLGIVEKLNSTGRFEADLNRIMGFVEDG
ncbi:MAG: hypothetical protein QFX34_01155 [Candidatus Verstraetearchaeota archaeon]|nr:hypothetical protein [Candidatus Verstraetearchaeota archaeon]